jgi:hypothetical protein
MNAAKRNSGIILIEDKYFLVHKHLIGLPNIRNKYLFGKRDFYSLEQKSTIIYFKSGRILLIMRSLCV